MTYSEKLKDPRWQKRRLEILSRDNFQCQFCGDTESTLHVHHHSYRGDPWEADDFSLSAICEQCHSISHAKKKLSNIEFELSEEITRNFFVRIDPVKLTKKQAIRSLELENRALIESRKRLFKILKRHGRI